MKETVKINLNQRLFDLDADAFEKLKGYLDSLAGYFRTSTQGADEILQDIEQRIAEILEEMLKRDKQVVTLQDIEEVIKMMGTTDDFARESEIAEDETDNKTSSQQSATYEDYSREHRKLYRDVEHNILGGVCTGIAAYFNVDPVWIRIAFVVLFFINLVGLIAYLILWVIVPPAVTTTQRLQMRGRPVTVGNIQESVTSEFHKVKDNFRRYTQSESFRKTRDTTNEVLATLGNIFLVLLKVILIIIGVGLVVAVVAVTLSIIAAFTAGGIWHGWHFPDLFFRQHITPLFHDFTLFTLALITVVLIPAIAILTGIIKLVFNIQTRNSILSAFAWTFWALALVFVVISFLSGEHGFSSRHQYKKEITTLDVEPNTTLYITLEQEQLTGEDFSYYSVLGREVIRDKSRGICYIAPSFSIESAIDDKTSLALWYNTTIPEFGNRSGYDKEYFWQLHDTILILGNYLKYDEEDVWMFPYLKVILYLPEEQYVRLSDDIEEIANRNKAGNVWPSWYYNTLMTIKDNEMMPVSELAIQKDIE